RASKHAERQPCNHAAQATERRCHLILKLAVSLPRVDETAVLASLSKLLFIHRLLGSRCRKSSLPSMRFHDNERCVCGCFMESAGQSADIIALPRVYPIIHWRAECLYGLY